MSDVEKQTAKRFSRNMKFLHFKLDFSQKSLELEIDKLLRSKIVLLRGKWRFAWRNKTGLEAYVGETLCRIYDGQWHGEFEHGNPGANYYLSYIKFGEYRFFPSRYLGYRISNGEKSEGTFNDYLEKVIPEIEAGKDVR